MKNSKRVLLSILALLGLLTLSVAIATAQGEQIKAVPTPLEKACHGHGRRRRTTKSKFTDN